MKRILTLCAAILLGVSALAQQALQGGPSTDSPVINPDGTVTCRYRAPDAVKVTLSGDFRPVQTAFADGGFDDIAVVNLDAELFGNGFADGMPAGTVFSADSNDHSC